MAHLTIRLLAVAAPVQRHGHELEGLRAVMPGDSSLSQLTTRPSFDEPAPGELPAFTRPSPIAVLECLKAHRYTALFCAQAAAYKRGAPPPPPPAPLCGSSSYKAICHFGRGTCLYSDVRGWFCACDRGQAGEPPDCIQVA